MPSPICRRAILDSAAKAGVRVDDIDWFVPHQANQRILDATAKKLGVSPERMVSTVAVHGNTSSASVPLALMTAVRDGRIKRGDLAAAGGHGRRLHLGRQPGPLVVCLLSPASYPFDVAAVSLFA